MAGSSRWGLRRRSTFNPTSAFVASFLGESNFIEVFRQPNGMVATSTGVVVAASGQAAEAWTTATLMVRPEALRLTRICGDNINGYNGSHRQNELLGVVRRSVVSG